MKYMGSKNRIAKHILPIMLAERKEGQYWVEPFVGGANIIDKVDGLRIGADLNKYLIAMWSGLQQGLDRPKEISKELYSKARTEYNNGTNIDFTDFMIGWIGWMGSFNGRFFDGGFSGVSGTRNYIDEQVRNTERQIHSIKDVKFVYSDYRNLQIPPNSIIYCDIPYKGKKQYATSKDFNHDDFWQWCRDMTKLGHTVFVSEYDAPSDFKCVWQKEITNSMNISKTYKPIEKLFKLAKKRIEDTVVDKGLFDE